MSKKAKILIIFLCLVLLCLLGAGVYFLLEDRKQAKESDFSQYKEYITDTSDAFVTIPPTTGSDEPSGESTEPAKPENPDKPSEPAKPSQPDKPGQQTPVKNVLNGLQGKNNDAVGWIKIPNTNIDYPIVQAEDNKFYLDHGFEKAKSGVGVPFLDYRCERDFSSFNSIVYAHHIVRRRLFTDLTLFKNKSFFDKQKTAELTLEDGKHQIYIVACLVVTSKSFVYDTVFLKESDKRDFVDALKDNATQYREPEEGVDLTKRRLVTLSTCSYEYDGARTAVVAYIK